MTPGKVYLVGAGPGDPGLVTRKALDCLARADVIVYDHLLDEQLLESARPDAEHIYAGKSGARHALEQDEINRLLVEKASSGRTVVRLKGGDPFVFGRGGEEAEVLNESGIEFEVVPGVTSAVAVPAYAGIPVTHRGVASSFAVITGHEDPLKGTSSLDWSHLATATDTLVILMGMANIGEIAARLVEHGRPASTPVAVIENGTRPAQRTVVGELANIAARVKETGVGAPAVIVVGEVVTMRQTLRWFDCRPLFGKRVLVTRARRQASALSRLLAEHGAQPVELPAIEIKEGDGADLDRAIGGLTRYDWVVFTSANGVEAFFGRLHALGRDARALNGVKIAAIGPATAAALQGRGIVADFCPATFTGAAIAAGLAEAGIAGQRFLLPRADIADGTLAEGIARVGGQVEEVAAYRTVPAPAARLAEVLAAGNMDIATFTSSSTVTNLAAALKASQLGLDGALIACIGPTTAAAAVKAGFRPDIVAAEHTIPGLVAAIEEHLAKET